MRAINKRTQTLAKQMSVVNHAKKRMKSILLKTLKTTTTSVAENQLRRGKNHSIAKNQKDSNNC